MNIKINKNVVAGQGKLPETTPLTLYFKIIFSASSNRIFKRLFKTCPYLKRKYLKIDIILLNIKNKMRK